MKKVQGNDCFQRINFLYQISKQISESNPALSSYYGNLIVNIAKKNVLKIHPDMKRKLCKKCRCLLGTNTSTTKIITKNKSKYLKKTCNTCGTHKCYLINRGNDYEIWLEKEEGVIEVIR